MQLTVHCAEWVLEDDGRQLAIGQELAERLVLSVDTGWHWPAETITQLSGVVSPLPRWRGLTLDHHPLRLDVGGAALYWESPVPVGAGVRTVTGVPVLDTHRVPDSWPLTRGRITRLRTEHRWYVEDAPGSRSWVPESAEARYVDVAEVGPWEPDGPAGPWLGGRRESWTGVLVDVDVWESAPG